MKRAMLMMVGAMLAVVPFAWGMVGNTTLTQPVPVRIPARAEVVPPTSAPTVADPEPLPAAIRPTDSVTARPVPTSRPSASASSEAERRGRGSDDRAGDDRRGRGRGGDDSKGHGRGGRDDGHGDDSGHGDDDSGHGGRGHG